MEIRKKTCLDCKHYSDKYYWCLLRDTEADIWASCDLWEEQEDEAKAMSVLWEWCRDNMG